jgi:hypothetical protein
VFAADVNGLSLWSKPNAHVSPLISAVLWGRCVLDHDETGGAERVLQGGEVGEVRIGVVVKIAGRRRDHWPNIAAVSNAAFAALTHKEPSYRQGSPLE